MLTTNVAVAAVTLPAESLVVTIVIVAVPLPLASAPVMAGTSLAGDSVATKVGLVGVVGAVDELPQPDTNTPRANRRDSRFISTTPFARERRSVELTGQVEAEREVVGHAAMRDLAER